MSKWFHRIKHQGRHSHSRTRSCLFYNNRRIEVKSIATKYVIECSIYELSIVLARNCSFEVCNVQQYSGKPPKAHELFVMGFCMLFYMCIFYFIMCLSVLIGLYAAWNQLLQGTRMLWKFLMLLDNHSSRYGSETFLRYWDINSIRPW